MLERFGVTNGRFGDGTGARTAERVDLQKAPVEPPKGGLVKGQASPSP